MAKKIGQYSGVTAVVYLDEEPKKFAVVKTQRGFSLPGGGFDEDDRSVEDALLREIEEELGLSRDHVEARETNLIESFQYDSHKKGRENQQVSRQVFIIKALNKKLRPLDTDVLEVQWYPLEEALKKLTWDNSKDTLKKASRLI